jgi:peptidoglycan/LPS O-acetylase OafA/YrhL
MGIFSYSHFLVHFPIIMFVLAMTRELGLTPHRTYLVMFLVAIPLSLLGGYLFYLAVERRFLPQYRRKAAVAPVPPVYMGVPALEGAEVDTNTP